MKTDSDPLEAPEGLAERGGSAAARSRGPQQSSGSSTGPWVIRACFYGGLVLLLAGMFLEVPREIVGLFGVGLMVLLLLMRAPIGVAMIAASSVGIFVLGGSAGLGSTLRTLPYGSVASWSFSVLPLFIFMGLLLWRAGASEKLYAAARDWLGWLPGGLAVGTNFAGAGMAAVSGSTLATTYAIGRVGLPEMLRAGYDRRYAVSTILMSGMSGQLIPPSIFLVVYAGIASVPVGTQLLAGILPGIMIAMLYAIFLVALAALMPRLAGRRSSEQQGQRPSLAVKWKSARDVWPIVALMVLVVGGMYIGVFTATEAGAFGATGSLLVLLLYRGVRASPSLLKLAANDTLRSTGAIFFVIIAASLLSRFLSMSGLARWFVEAIGELGLNRVEFLLLMVLVYLLLGMVLEPVSMMLTTVPILMPVLVSLDVSLIWFGVFVVLLGEIAVVTPPVGVVTYVVYKMAQDKAVNLGMSIPLRDVFVGVLWFLPMAALMLLVLIFAPQLVELVPNWSNQ